MSTGFEVATDTLRKEAGVWDQQSKLITEIASQADQLRFTRIEAGIFQLIVTPYGEVVDAVTTRCKEGGVQMTDIATTLRQVATIYDEEERNGVHRLMNLR
jgi:hypothetical protein